MLTDGWRTVMRWTQQRLGALADSLLAVLNVRSLLHTSSRTQVLEGNIVAVIINKTKNQKMYLHEAFERYGTDWYEGSLVL